MEDAFARDASEVITPHCSVFDLRVRRIEQNRTPLLQVLRLLNVDPGVGLSDAEVSEVGSLFVSPALL